MAPPQQETPETPSPPIRRLYDLAYGREGDKGNIANVSVIARTSAAYAELKAKATAARVKRHLGPLVQGQVVRHELDNIEEIGRAHV